MGATQSASNGEQGIVTVVSASIEDEHDLAQNVSEDEDILLEVERQLTLLGSQLRSIQLQTTPRGPTTPAAAAVVTSPAARAAAQAAPHTLNPTPSTPRPTALSPTTTTSSRPPPDLLGIMPYVTVGAQKSEAASALMRQLLITGTEHRRWLARAEAEAAGRQAKLHTQVAEAEAVARGAVERAGRTAAAQSRAAESLSSQLALIAAGVDALACRCQALSLDLSHCRTAVGATAGGRPS